MPRFSRKLLLFSTAFIFGGLALVVPLAGRADPIDDFAAKERQLSEAAGQVQSLGDELRLLDETIAAKQTYLTEVSVQTAKVRAELKAINDELAELQNKRQTTQDRLNVYVRTDYLDRPNEYTVLASRGSLSDSMALSSYVRIFQDRTEGAVNQLSKIERRIGDKQEDVRSRYQVLDNYEQEVSRQTAELTAVRTVKQQWLDATKGQEDQFRQQFEESRDQLVRLGLFAKNARDRIGSRVWPDTGFYFNQLDSRWAGMTLGFSGSSTIGDYGCGLTSLAMVFKSYGINTSPPALNADLRRVRAFVGDLMNWRNAAAASGGRLTLANNPYPIGRGNVDWGLINRQLDTGNPVIVFIDRAGQVSHYVTLIERRGDGYLMHDPIEGPYLRFGDYYSTSAVYQFITFRRT